jgi:hypothetical protein
MVSGDVDGDSRQELILLTDKVIEIFAFEADKFRRLCPAYSVQNDFPGDVILREPVGQVFLMDINEDNIPEIIYGTSATTKSYILQYTRSGLQKWLNDVNEPVIVPNIPLFPMSKNAILTAPLIKGRSYYSPQGVLFHIKSGKEESYPLPKSVFAYQKSLIKTAKGMIKYHAYLDTNGKLTVIQGELGTSPLRVFQKAGLAFEIFDVQDDGYAEIAVTDAALPESADFLRLFDLTSNEKSPPIYKSEGLMPIYATASGDVNNDGAIELVLAGYSPDSRASVLYLLAPRWTSGE